MIPNGGGVFKKKYLKKYPYIAGYGRPKYDVRATCVLGDFNDDVLYLQQRLMSLGYELPKYGADGDFGDNTYEAVKKFQTDYKVYPIDGEVGPLTAAALNKAISRTEAIKKNDIVMFKGDICYNTAIATP